jgi:hypothetical protein
MRWSSSDERDRTVTSLRDVQTSVELSPDSRAGLENDPLGPLCTTNGLSPVSHRTNLEFACAYPDLSSRTHIFLSCLVLLALNALHASGLTSPAIPEATGTIVFLDHGPCSWPDLWQRQCQTMSAPGVLFVNADQIH